MHRTTEVDPISRHRSLSSTVPAAMENLAFAATSEIGSRLRGLPLQTLAVLTLSLWLGLSQVANCMAQEPLQLSNRQIEELKRAGDRLADQGDYLNALRKYTKAYLGVVADIRGQDFSKEVEPKMFNREDLGKEMIEQLDKEYTDEDLALMDGSYRALGLMPPDLDSKELVTKLLTEEVAGFYDPDNKRMVLIVEDGPKEPPSWLGRLLGARPTFDKDEQKTTLAHELTHALQDQLYDLNAMQEGIEDDDDMLLAFSALVEGDATLLMFAEPQGGDISDMDPDAMRATFNMMSWMMPLAGGNTYRKAPPIFRESLVFPYFQGMLFTLAVAGQNGWQSIHSAYQHPPLSTEQILHPEKYLDQEKLDVPQRVTIPDVTAQIGEHWKRLGGNCLGELQTYIMLKKVRGGKKASLGWDGDSYEIYQHENGKLALVFVSVWDSPEDADEFAKVYSTYRSQNPMGTDSVFYDSAEHQVQVKEDKVYIVGGFEDSVTTQVMEALQSTTFADKTFPLPAPGDSPADASAVEKATNDTVIETPK